MLPELELARAYAALAAALPIDPAPPGAVEMVTLADALRRVLAQPLVASSDLPAEDVSAMDGYALRSAEATCALSEFAVAGRVLAGERATAAPAPGHCLRIMTGAPLPPQCDAVVPLEAAAELSGGRVRLPGPVAPYLNCRRRGEDVAAGSRLLEAGRLLRPADLGLASALGRDRLAVRRPLRVGVLSTGSELRDAPHPLGEAATYDSNRPMLLAALGGAALQGVDLGICPDDSGALQRTIARAGDLALDALLVTGAAAQGDADVVRQLAGVRFEAVGVRPGRGIAYGQLALADGRALPLLGLPGNAVAAYVLFHLLARQLLLRLAGANAGPPAWLRLPLCAAAPVRAGRIEARRARLVADAQGRLALELLRDQGSAMLRTVAQADALVLLGPQGEAVAGSLQPCVLLDALAWP